MSVDVDESAFAGEAEPLPEVAADVPGVRNDHNLREYWVHGKGAIKIRWGQKGDFLRCVRQVRKYSKGGTAFDPKGYCAELHHEALGVWPGREHGKKHTAVTTAVNVEEFNRLHPRGFHGMFGHKGGIVDADSLGLADRIKLGEGERLAGSDRFMSEDGDVPLVAWVDGPAGPRMRLGLIPAEDTGKWEAGKKGGTVELDGGQAAELREQLRGLAETADTLGEMTPEAQAQQDDLIQQRNRIMARTVGPGRTRVPLGDADKQALADVDGQLDALERNIDSWPQFDGAIDTPWGQLSYELLDNGEDADWSALLEIGDQRSVLSPDELAGFIDYLEPDMPSVASYFDELKHFRDMHGKFSEKFGPHASHAAGLGVQHGVMTLDDHQSTYGDEWDSAGIDYDDFASSPLAKEHGLNPDTRGLYVGVYGDSPENSEAQILFHVGDDEHVQVALDGLDAQSLRNIGDAVFKVRDPDFEQTFEDDWGEDPNQDPAETVLDETEVPDLGLSVAQMGDGVIRVIDSEDPDKEYMALEQDQAEKFEDALTQMADSLEERLADADDEDMTVAAALPLPGDMWHAVAHVEGLSTGSRMWEPGAITWREPPFAFMTEEQSSAHGSPMVTVQVGLVTRMMRIGDEIHAWGTLDLDSVKGLDLGRRMVQGFARWVSMDPDEQKIAYDVIMPEGATHIDTPPDQVIFYTYNIAGLVSVSMPAQQGSYLEPLPALTDALIWKGVIPDDMATPEPVTAAAVPSHDTPTSDKPWDADANVGRLPSPMSVETARNVYAWIDSSRVEDGMLPKDGAKFPHHIVSADGTPGAADLAACSAGIAALNGARGGTDIPSADRKGVYNHLRNHLLAGGREAADVPKLSTSIGGALTVERTPVTAAAVTHVLELPDLPPAEWFEEPVEMDAEPGGPIHITDQGRIYGWLAPENIAHRSHARNGVRKEFGDLGKIDFSRWMGETIVAGGGRVLSGPITMECGHAPTSGYGSLAARNQHYDNTCSIVGRASTGIGTRHKGQWIAGALMPWVTAEQFTKILVSRMSGDWQPHPEKRGWQEFIAALVVPVGGWPGSRTAITTASALAPVYSIEEDEEFCWLSSASVPITAAGCGCYVIEDDVDEEEPDEDDTEESWKAEDDGPMWADPDVMDMYAAQMGLDRRSTLKRYAAMLG